MGIVSDRKRISTKAHVLATRIRERIQAERVPDGAFFMTEAQLAEEYDASRTVVREALNQLQALGILEGRKRKGLYVRRPDPIRLFAHSLPSLASSSEDWREVGLLRYALEIGAVELAIRAASDEQIDRLEAVQREFEGELRKDPYSARCVELDMTFHSQILQMTGSRLIAGMQQVLVRFFQIAPTVGGSDVADRVAWEHRELVRAIRDRDVEAARAMIRAQMRSTLAMADTELPKNAL